MFSNTYAVLLPSFALIFWSFLVLLLMVTGRVRAVKNREVHPRYFRTYQKDVYEVPEKILRVSRHFDNLMATPMWFYFMSLACFVSKQSDMVFVLLGWIYFAMRLGHSIIHLSYNHIVHRMLIFTASIVILVIYLVRLVWLLVSLG